MSSQRLWIIRGAPGSGKSTIAKMIIKYYQSDVHHFENDMYHIVNGVYCFNSARHSDAIRWCKRKSFESLSLGVNNVIVCNIFDKVKYINPYADRAKRMDIAVRVIRCTGNWNNMHDVPEDYVELCKHNMEPYNGETIFSESQLIELGKKHL